MTFHGSSIQDQKIIKPKLTKTSSPSALSKLPKIYATDDLSYASVFTFDWDDSMGSLGKYEKEKYWKFTLKKEFEYLIHQSPCSIYILRDTNFIHIPDKSVPEYNSYSDEKVLKEIKFQSPFEAMRKCRVIIKIIGNK